MLGNKAGKLVFLGLSEAILEGVGTLHDVLLVQIQILEHKVDVWHAISQLHEGLEEVLAPLRVISGGNTLRSKDDLDRSLEVLVVRLKRIVAAKVLDPCFIDLFLVNLLFLNFLTFCLCFCFSLGLCLCLSLSFFLLLFFDLFLLFLRIDGIVGGTIGFFGTGFVFFQLNFFAYLEQLGP